MSSKPHLRVADRLSRPHPDNFLTFMVVLTRRTFRLTVRRKFVFWAMGIAAGICAVSIVGSWYGFWATKKIMSFSHLEKETKEQQEQLRESLEQAEELQRDVVSLQGQVNELLNIIVPPSKASKASPDSSTSDAKAAETKESSEKVSALKNDLGRAEDRLKAIQAKMEPILHQWSITPSVMPTTGNITSAYGARIHPFMRNSGGNDLTHHTGIDIANDLGTPIQATANGKVVYVGAKDNYGLTVIVQHSPQMETLYAHLHRAHVRVGQEVERGHILGAMGRTGRATGVHLHYEVRRNEQPINPKPFLQLQSQWLTGLR